MTGLAGAELTAAVNRLVVARDGEEYVLGRPDLAIYVVVPEPGAVFVESLQAGDPLPVATARASEVAGEPVDGPDFLQGLGEAGLLTAPPAAGAPGDARGREIRWLEGVSQQRARRLFGPTAWTVYAVAAAFSLVVLVARSDMRPSYEHFWWLPDPVLSVLTLLVIGVAMTALHEAWHWLAGRAVGVPATFRVSYRGIFLVFETDLTQLVTVPRRKRYSPFLAGMAFDVTVLAMALGLRLGHREDLLVLPSWLDRLLAAVVLAQVIRVVWQWAALFLRSDGYAVLANALRCHDLYRATWLTTKDRLWRLSDAEAAELASISDHDRRVARVFGFGYLAGVVVMAWMMLTFAIPFMVSMVLWVSHNLLNPAIGSVAFWESVAVVVVVVGQYAIIPVLAVRERRLRQRGELR